MIFMFELQQEKIGFMAEYFISIAPDSDDEVTNA